MEMLQMRLRIEALEKRVAALEGEKTAAKSPTPVEPEKVVKKPTK